MPDNNNASVSTKCRRSADAFTKKASALTPFMVADWARASVRNDIESAVWTVNKSVLNSIPPSIDRRALGQEQSVRDLLDLQREIRQGSADLQGSLRHKHVETVLGGAPMA